MSTTLCKWPHRHTVTRPGNSIAKWLSAAGQSATGRVQRTEIAFLEMMIKHHASAVREAGLCVRGASHADLKTFCSNVHTAQEAEIAQMKGWLCQWYQKCR